MKGYTRRRLILVRGCRGHFVWGSEQEYGAGATQGVGRMTAAGLMLPEHCRLNVDPVLGLTLLMCSPAPVACLLP